jgi:hypothetical protein
MGKSTSCVGTTHLSIRAGKNELGIRIKPQVFSLSPLSDERL